MNKIVLLLMIGISSLYSEELPVESTGFFQWWSLIALAIVGVLILFFSSRQMSKIKKLHEEIDVKQKEMEKNQNDLLTNMSENIYDIAKDAIKNRSRVLNEPDERSLENVLAKVINAENALLDMTNDLIGFLRIKSKKVEITNEKFNINNVLNEIAGSLSMHFKESDTELIFDLESDIPRYLMGDSLHLGQILGNLIEHSMLHTSKGEIRLEVFIFKTLEGKSEIEFKVIDTSRGMTPETMETLFEPYYSDESKEYVGLGLFVAKELTNLMGGKIAVDSIIDKGTTFTVVLPLDIVETTNEKEYMLCEKTAKKKKVLIADGNYNSALAIRKMFTYFNYDVNIVSESDFNIDTLHLTEYDIILLDDTLFTPKIVEYIEKTVDYLENIGKEHTLKVISLNSILHTTANSLADDVADRKLKKPLTQERIFELLTDIYQDDIPKNLPIVGKVENNMVFTHQEALEEAENIRREHFADFNGSSILLVEDNLINQKVLVNILDKADIKITIANNGLEALNIVTAQEQYFDLVLMDINMPVMDGYTATEKIRKSGKFDDLPIVAFTALVLDSEIQKMYNCGMNAFLSKPLNMGKMYSAFELFLDINMASVRPEIPEEEPVKEIDGLDVEAGIQYANGNPAIYMEVLN